MKIREQIIKLKEQNKAFKSKRKSLKQWVSYFDQIMETPGKDHRHMAKRFYSYLDEIDELTLKIDSNGKEIQRLRLKKINNDKDPILIYLENKPISFDEFLDL